MKIKALKLLTLASLMIACALPVLFLSGKASSEPDSSSAGLGLSSVETFNANYKAWEAEYVKKGGDRNMVLAMGWFKGLSTGQSRASGVARLNLIDGVVSVEINGLPKEEGWDLWLIDSVAGRSIMPEPDDAMLRIGSLKHEGKLARFDANLGSDAFASFDMDLIIVTKAGKNPTEDRTLVGTTSLFHRVYRSAQRGQFGVLADADPIPPAPDNRSVLQRLADTISPTALAQIGPIPNPSTPQEILITAGRQSFFNDTFQGNGRTCGTCHREDNNLTIDAEFIETLPPNDPLFVAEFTPALSANFENPVLMRKFGMILENVDGFGDLANRFVMRGVPHTLALLPNTLAPFPGDGTTIPPNERTGWSGDGAPGTGTLREFIIGAITQHYPKTLARQVGSDFILPTVAQLDALEAFQKSTGRRQDLVLTGPGALSLKGEMPRRGQEIFNAPGSVLGQSNEGAGKCFFCHFNAGAGDFFSPGGTGTQNANFNTNVEQLPSQPADLVQPPQNNPPDGGFGQGTPPAGVFGIGNGSFNTPVLVEAADTPPFFHNNSITTIEGAVDFYNSEAFNNAPGFGPVIGGIRLEATEVEAVAAFLRVINALENIRSSIDLQERAKVAVNFSQAQELLRLSISELNDAIEVLDCANLHPDAVRKLREALAIDVVALVTNNQGVRNALINQAITRKNQAKAIMAN